MGKKLNKKIRIIYKMDDGRTSIVEGEISSKNRKSFFVKAVKRIILALDRKGYDLSEVTFSTIEIIRKSIQNISPANHKFNLTTEGFDDGEY